MRSLHIDSKLGEIKFIERQTKFALPKDSEVLTISNRINSLMLEKNEVGEGPVNFTLHCMVERRVEVQRCFVII